MQLSILAPNGKPYEPLPKQIEFHAEPAKYRAYVGGFGSGKTLCGCAEALALSLDYPGNVGLIGRKSYKELKATTQAEFLRICPPELIKTFNKTDGDLVLKNGSKILFWNLQDIHTFRSLNLGWFYLDEASEIEEDVFLTLKGRLRLSHGLNGAPIRRCGFLTTNPNGHDWIWKWFVQRKPNGHRLIHAPTKENKYLPPDYIQDLQETYPPEWLSRFMEGSFDVFEGQVYPSLDERTHMIPAGLVSKAMEYISRLPIKLRGIDHGFANPTVCLWCAVDRVGNLFFYREYRATRRLISENCQEIVSRSGEEEYFRTIIDPSTRNRTGQGVKGLSFLEEYRENGVNAELGNNQMRAGILRVADYLRPRRDHSNPITGVKPAPMLYFLPDCHATFEELRQLQWKRLKPGQERNAPEEPVDKDDHGADVVRYIVMDRPIPSPEEVHRNDYDRIKEYVRAFAGEGPGEYGTPRIGREASEHSILLPDGSVIIN